MSLKPFQSQPDLSMDTIGHDAEIRLVERAIAASDEARILDRLGIHSTADRRRLARDVPRRQGASSERHGSHHGSEHSARLEIGGALGHGSRLLVIGVAVFASGCVVAARPFVQTRVTWLIAVPVAGTAAVLLLGIVALLVASLVEGALSWTDFIDPKFRRDRKKSSPRSGA